MKKPGQELDKGIENGRQWFGAFLSISPGTSKSLSFEYYLPSQVDKQIDENMYTLVVQKQLGLNDAKLTVGLDFGKNIELASPSPTDNLSGFKYVYKTDLETDKEFAIKLK